MLGSKKEVIRGGALLIAGIALASASALSTTAMAEPRVLSYASATPPSDTGINNALRWMAEEVEKRTDGDLKIEIHWMGALVRLRDAVDGVSSGVADMGYVIPAYSQSRMPLHYLASTGLGSGDQWVTQEAWTRMYDEFPELEEELERNNMVYIGHYSIGPTVFMSKERPYITPEDFQGDRVRLSSRYANAARLENWRVTAVNLTFPDIYTGLERGTIDGAVTYLNQIIPYRHNEVANYVTEPNLGQQTNPVVMNRRVWNSLSESEQQVFKDLREEYLERMVKGDLADTEKNREHLATDEEYPMEFVDMTEEQRQVWAEGLQEAEEENVERTEARHPAARDLYDAYMAEIDSLERELESEGYPWERD